MVSKGIAGLSLIHISITQCLDYIKETGTIAVYGLKSGENLNVPLPELRNFNIQYVQWPVPEVEAEVHKPVCDAIMDGKIDIDLFVTHRFSIDDYEKGFQAVKDRTCLLYTSMLCFLCR